MATPNLGFQNFFTTTLASGITASDTTIYLNSLPTPTEGYLVIEPDSSTNKEIIYYTSKGANFVTLPSVAAGRGVGGTSAVSHNSGVTCQMNVVAEHFEALQDGTAFAVGGIGASAYADGWAPILGSTPSSVTYNGNRNYDLVFNSVDLTSTLSPGMRLKATRTVAAPTQCTDLESGSSQYYSKTSPAGLSFTTTWTAMAWVKLESYGAQSGIIARRNADTEGWSFSISSTGQVKATSLRIASNNSDTVSYASIPLNKWVHVAAATDLGGTTLLYIDGVLVPSLTTVTGTAATLVQGTTALVVGATKSAGTEPFDGKIAQAAIFSSKLSAATIASYINQTLSGSESTLISAYSFNGVITDLNTTNANNLTANGSAVATNADSPYANAVTAGLLEYGLVQKATFSTNTTVNVQVPEGCAIPTTGGVTAVSYSTNRSPFGWVSNTDRWTLKSILRSSMSTTLSAINGWYSSNHKIVAPIGDWIAGYQINILFSSTVGGVRSGQFSVDSTSYPVVATKFNDACIFMYQSASMQNYGVPASKEFGRTFTASETITATGAIDSSTGTETYQIRGDLGDCVLYLKPAAL